MSHKPVKSSLVEIIALLKLLLRTLAEPCLLALALSGARALIAQEPAVDPRGPLLVPGIRAHLVPGGVEAIDYKPAKELRAAPGWTASWVWLAPEADAVKTAVACFRKEVTFSVPPQRVAAWVSADWHYRLYINGKLAARGPADPGEDYPSSKSSGKSGLYFADFCDLTPLFHAGKNVISAEVFEDRLSAWWGSSGSRGFFFQAEARLNDQSIQSIESDESWRACSGRYLLAGADLKYFADQEPVGWRLAGFEDASWPRCVKAENHWPRLWPSELPQAMEIIYPPSRVINASPGLKLAKGVSRQGRSVVFTADGEFTLQYDRVLAGYAGLKIKGDPGATVSIDFNEVPGRVRHAASLVLGKGMQYFETPYYTSFAFLRVRVAGVRSRVEIQDVRAISTSQPLTCRGSFRCSDDALNRIWTASRWATQLCMQDRYLDSPNNQEPISDPGDYLIESLVNYYTFDEPALTRQDLRKFSAILAHNGYINFHTSYSLLWLQMLLDYYDYTGDLETVRELAPQVHGLLEKFNGWRGKNGLISEAPDYMFMDWVNIGGFGTHHPPAVIGQGYLTAFYYRALSDARRVAESTGENRLVARYDQLRLDVAKSYNRELWNAEKGLYRDGKPFQTSVSPSQWLPADKEIETFSTQNNVLAVLYDLAPKENQVALMTRLLGGDLNCQPYFMHFLLSALAHCGLFDSVGPSQMRRWKIVPETQTFREMWGRGDLSHGWGGTPLYQMGSQILGVRPLAPGFIRLAIRPLLCDLKWAEGKVPTPHGDVALKWALTANGMRLDVVIPAGTEAEVTLPTAQFSNPRVTLKGRELPGGSVADLGAGHYRFVLTGKLSTPRQPL